MNEYELNTFFESFLNEMKNKYYATREEKGDSWLNPKNKELLKFLKMKMKEHAEAENYIDVANFALFLFFNENKEKREEAIRNSIPKEICIDGAPSHYEE